jgi:hypothetical protein
VSGSVFHRATAARASRSRQLAALIAVVVVGTAAPAGAQQVAASGFTVMTAATKVAVTNDRRAVAGGIYDAVANTTFISWAGSNVDNYVQSYNGTWSAPKRVGGGDGDPHNYPTIVQANDGHLLVFRGLHNVQLMESSSPQPHSVAGTWNDRQITQGPAATYPMPVKADNGDIYVFYRQTDNALISGTPTDERPMEYVRSTTNGTTWTSSKTIAGAPYVIGSTDRSDHMNEIYIGQIRHEENPERFSIVWTLAGGGSGQHKHDAFHKNVYYAYFTPADQHFHNAAGQDLGTAIPGNAMAACLVADTGKPVDKNPGYFQLTGTFGDGTPVVVYTMKDGNHAGHWTGTAWQTAKLGTGYVMDMEPVDGNTFRVYTRSGSTVTTYLLDKTPAWTPETSFTAPGAINHGVLITGYRDPARLLLEGTNGGGIYVAGGS